MMEIFDLLLKNALIVSVDDENRIFENGYIAVNNGKIVKIGENEKGMKGKIEEDLQGAIVMPGLVNTHTHAAMTMFRGIADDLPLMEWLNNHIFPAEAALTSDMVYYGTLLACIEMLKSGTTTFCDMYFFEEDVARAANDAGMRAFVGEGIINFPTPGCESPEKALEKTEKLYKKYKDDPLVQVCVAPHSVYLTDEKYLLAADEISKKYNLPFVIHLSETRKEVDDFLESKGKTPVAYLDDLGILSSRTVSVHSVAVDEKDIELFVKNRVSISHNPESNMKLASGIAPVPEFLDAGLCVTLGTDGAASNNDLCLLSEMDTAAKLHKVNKLDPTVLSAREVLRMSTIEGAKSLGIDNKTGSLEEGKDADFVILNSDLPGLVPIYNPESHIVYSASRKEVKDVYVKGKRIVKNGKMENLNTKDVVKKVRELASVIKGR